MAAISLTENNRHFANAVNKRITADGTMLSAKASVWRLGGIGLMLLMAGAGIGCVLFGYSHINDDQALADRMATSFAKALEQIKIPIAGGVEVKPGGMVDIQPGATVELQPGGKVQVTGGVEVKPGGVVSVKSGGVITQPNNTSDPRPTPQQLYGTNPPPANQQATKVVTNYTIFKVSAFRTGAVYTGWDFSSSEQAYPTSQYCYYSPETGSSDTTEMTFLFRKGQLSTFGARDDWKAALALCVWFNGQPPSQ